MDLETLRSTLEQASLASLGVGFIAGFIFSFNPVALAAIPVSLAYVTKAHETKRAVLFGAMFIAGMVVTHVLMGFVAGFGGLWVQKLIGREWGLVLGPLLILLGLMWPGWIKLPFPVITIRAKRPNSGWGAFLLGIPFSVAVCPFCTPALIILLGVVTGIGSHLFGVTLLLAFALGRAVPIILGAWAVGWLEGLKSLQHSQKIFEIIGALLLILSGVYMLNAYFIFIPELAA
ncbi:MAG: cytochrome C biogenesis protein [Gallionellales bacterium 35-53-114]|jgi:cytochrome c-type biogenesis protein|nr:MAG: cytochrome C biogenesis protein [Gallionellales bacterium 35-53-114]OYZ64945.1 MAG: cytochrome C biogenesis protein [Gallionellales bacterium 24-53-125]OZB07517.1 MAG: cytochrome C biogenesis protein [Gallionellales bacterium 39-52-133]HQS58811.1 cytochrome c biogenesis protein CcdA [Gallionellaceae bacterium]HQS75152.1 cytochrome c biogenesis protein CcdA [Gallionellaceae bacterium]